MYTDSRLTFGMDEAVLIPAVARLCLPYGADGDRLQVVERLAR